MNQDEQVLIQQAQQGDTAAFGQLVNIHGQLVYNLALRTLNDAQEAEDVAQEAFVRAWQGLPRFRAEARFTTWLYRIVTNLCYNRLPRLKVELAALDPDEAVELPDERQRVEEAMLTDELKTRLYTAVDELPESYRLLIFLRHLQEMSYAEIAAVTKMPLGTVKTGIFRARRLLRETIEEDERFAHG